MEPLSTEEAILGRLYKEAFSLTQTIIDLQKQLEAKDKEIEELKEGIAGSKKEAKS